MRVCFLIIALTVLFYTCEANRKRKFEGDFKYGEEGMNDILHSEDKARMLGYNEDMDNAEINSNSKSKVRFPPKSKYEVRWMFQHLDMNGDGQLPLQETERPCEALVNEINNNNIGDFVPQCDSEGYFEPEQCYAAEGICWCVDRDGVEIEGTLTSDSPNCDALLNKPAERVRQISTNSIDEENADRPEKH